MKNSKAFYLFAYTIAIYIFTSAISACCGCRTATIETVNDSGIVSEVTPVENGGSDTSPVNNMIAGGFGGVFYDHLFRKCDLVRKIPATGGHCLITYNPEANNFNSVYFSYVLGRDIFNARPQLNLAHKCNDMDKTDCYMISFNNEHLLDYDKCGLIKTGDVIGCSVTDIENIPGYDVLCEKGVKFVNREIIKNTLSFKAGENEWAEVQISGQSHCITIIATPNHTGKERILSIGLDAIYLQASVFPFLDNAIRIIQPAE